ncbi:MAG: hypothetical protein AAB850_02195 [Patescibacteria group bacterium]
MDTEEPKKYIRTFAGDIEILHEGGKPDLAPLKTYAGDFSDRIKEENASFATVLAAEQDSGPLVVEKEKPKFSRSGILYTIAGSMLLIASITGAYIAYTRYRAAVAPVEPAPSALAPIFVDDREQISGTGQALSQAIEQSTARLLASGSVRLLYLASTTPERSVFAALHTSAPDVVLRNIRTESSMAGVVHVGGTQSPFFILSVASYSDTFAGMLSWERSMPRDLAVLFPLNASTTVAAFRDEVVSNHDVRVYRDDTGKSILLYGYWNQATLVIARDPAAFAEIVQRLSTSRTQP